ncbi:hypothetical protein ACFO9Q_19295 [Paenibacillus sp. GCM10023252]|uniref:hypothetical protein n=1 Tax=Paenibacillus sp. GCM10023252 TaxID=3252649 RepID=UPI00360F3541
MQTIRQKRIALSLLLSLIIVLGLLWRIGMLGIWTEGIGYIADRTTEYSNDNGHDVQGDYSIAINLADLESNIGKEIYNDGNYKIYVAWVNTSESINTGGYNIGFRSSGKYSRDGATLVSGVKHITLDHHSFTSEMSAKMTAQYRSVIYNSSTYGTSGLNYKDGDDFSFYIFPSEAYESGGVTLNETGVVQVTLSNLYKNVWTKR